MTLSVELEQLLNLSLGSPEVGAVNFNILHGVLREMLKHLGIDKKTKEIGDDGEFRAAYALLKGAQGNSRSEENVAGKDGAMEGDKRAPVSPTLSPQFGSLETKVSQIERKLEALDDLPSNGEILQRAKQRREGKTPVADMWQFINLNRRLGAAETGIEKLTSLLDSMMSEVNDVKELGQDITGIKKQISELEKTSTGFDKRISALESIDNSEEMKKIEDLLNQLKNLKKQVNELPTRDDLEGMMEIYVKWPQLEEALNAGRTRTPTPKPRTPTPTAPTPPRSPAPMHPSVEALEALRQVGELMEKHEDVAEKVEKLEETMPKKANLDDLEELRKRPDVPDDILEQLKKLKEGLDALTKWKEESTVPADLTAQLKALRDGVGALDSHRDQITALGEQLERLKEVSEMLNYHNEKLHMIPDDLLDQLSKLKYLQRAFGQTRDSNDQLLARIRRLEENLKEDMEKEIRTIRDGMRLLNNQLEKYKKMTTLVPETKGTSGPIKDGGALNALRNMLLELQADHEKLNNTTKELIEEHNRKQKHIDALYSHVDGLQEKKADKEYVEMEIDVKADKRALDNLISRTKFDQSVGAMEQALQDLLQRLEGNESSWKDLLEKLNSELDSKLDRTELSALKDYFERRLKNVKCKHPGSDLPISDDPAAGFRKALLRFHCISCDRPVDMVPGSPTPALPNTPGLPPSRSGRPYTTYELDQIRQMNRGTYNYDQDAMTTARSCGGSHTVTFPHRRTQRFNQQYYYYKEEEQPIPIPQTDETNLVGQDGHIYKGRMDDRPQSSRQKPTSPRVMSARTPSNPQTPRTGSPTNRRPRSAAPMSPRVHDEGVEPPTIPAQ